MPSWGMPASIAPTSAAPRGASPFGTSAAPSRPAQQDQAAHGERDGAGRGGEHDDAPIACGARGGAALGGEPGRAGLLAALALGGSRRWEEKGGFAMARFAVGVAAFSMARPPPGHDRGAPPACVRCATRGRLRSSSPPASPGDAGGHVRLRPHRAQGAGGERRMSRPVAPEAVLDHIPPRRRRDRPDGQRRAGGGARRARGPRRPADGRARAPDARAARAPLPPRPRAPAAAPRLLLPLARHALGVLGGRAATSCPTTSPRCRSRCAAARSARSCIAAASPPDAHGNFSLGTNAEYVRR